jgi:glutamate--cysteine ligase
VPAFWTGLLYEQGSLDAAWDMVKNWTAAERQALREAVPRQGLKAMIRGRTVQEIAKDVLGLSRGGLEQRNQQGCKGKTEASFLDVLDETAHTGKTAAQNLLDLYNGAWNGNIERVFRDFAY